MRRDRPRAWALAAVIVLASCTSSEVTQIGPRRPARSYDCAADVVRDRPSFAVVDLAVARAHCPFEEPPYRGCLEELRTRACQVGADVIYGLTETLSVPGNGGQVNATLALRSGSAPASDACTPICSPGFDCQAGRCIPLCNPACAPTETCNIHRTCEPAPAAAAQIARRCVSVGYANGSTISTPSIR